MKAYTDISQSKVLAEILSIESADMMWKKELKYRFCSDEHEVAESDFIYSIEFKEEKIMMSDFDIPCWSLAALLEILPLEIETHKQTDGYKIYYYVESYMKRNENEIYLSTERHENLVDACYEIILKLHKLNLL